MTIIKMKCNNCDEETDKYKCSKCEVYCCSLGCYKSHKDSSCTPISNAEITKNDEAQRPTMMPFKTDDTVETEKLQMLENNTELKNLLCNPHLRQFVREVDCSSNPWKAMKIAMLEPLFVEFANECLKTVEPENRD